MKDVYFLYFQADMTITSSCRYRQLFLLTPKTFSVDLLLSSYQIFITFIIALMAIYTLTYLPQVMFSFQSIKLKVFIFHCVFSQCVSTGPCGVHCLFSDFSLCTKM